MIESISWLADWFWAFLAIVRSVVARKRSNIWTSGTYYRSSNDHVTSENIQPGNIMIKLIELINRQIWDTILNIMQMVKKLELWKMCYFVREAERTSIFVELLKKFDKIKSRYSLYIVITIPDESCHQLISWKDLYWGFSARVRRLSNVAIGT